MLLRRIPNVRVHSYEVNVSFDSNGKYTCDVCKTSNLTKDKITRPMAERHKCLACEKKPLPGAPKRPPDDKLRADADKGAPTVDVYFRRMSQGEWDAIHKNSKSNLAAALDYANARNYRLW